MRGNAWLAAAIMIAACGGAQREPTPAPPPAVPDAGPPPVDRAAIADLADGVLEVLRAMAEVVEARAQDCPAMAADLLTVFAHAETIFGAVREADADPARHAVLLEELDARAAVSAGLADRIALGLAPCRDDPELQRAMARMPVL
jgi:hypothetical protein